MDGLPGGRAGGRPRRGAAGPRWEDILIVSRCSQERKGKDPPNLTERARPGEAAAAIADVDRAEEGKMDHARSAQPFFIFPE